jgi:hypothetical protein
MGGYHFGIPVMRPDRRGFVIQQKGRIGFVFTFDQRNDGMCKVKQAFDTPGEKSDQIVFITNPGDVIS